MLILTARDGVEDRILGLDRGGDDYLAKPFALGELEARLRALSRRRSDAPAQKRLGRLCFDSVRNEVQVDGQRIELTARELSLVEALMQHPGRTVTKQRLFDALYSWDHEANLSVIEVHVSRLRRKLEQARAGVGIRMLRGLGYRLEAGVTERVHSLRGCCCAACGCPCWCCCCAAQSVRSRWPASTPARSMTAGCWTRRCRCPSW